MGARRRKAVGGVLGRTVRGSVQHLDTFPAPALVLTVVLHCNEGTSMCPKTGQPDMWSAVVEYTPHRLCIESKSMKLFLLGFRNKGVFCESLAQAILKEIMLTVRPINAEVTVKQVSRGGIAIHATASDWIDLAQDRYLDDAASVNAKAGAAEKRKDGRSRA